MSVRARAPAICALHPAEIERRPGDSRAYDIAAGGGFPREPLELET